MAKIFTNPARSQPHVQRLEDLGRAVAARPMDTVTLSRAKAALGNEELALEAAATAALFEAISKIVDATNRPEMARAEFVFFKNLFILLGWIYHACLWFQKRLAALQAPEKKKKLA